MTNILFFIVGVGLGFYVKGRFFGGGVGDGGKGTFVDHSGFER